MVRSAVSHVNGIADGPRAARARGSVSGVTADPGKSRIRGVTPTVLGVACWLGCLGGFGPRLSPCRWVP